MAITPALRLLPQLLHSPGNSPVPGVIFFYGHCRVLFILLHFCRLFLLLAHKQCGQFRFTLPGVPDSSPASMARSGYTAKCGANKMHKAEIGKSMPLLITLRRLSRRLPGRAGASVTTQARPGALPLAPCPLPLVLLEQDQAKSPGRCPAEHRFPPSAEVQTRGWERGVIAGSRASQGTTLTLGFFICKTGAVTVPASEGISADVGRGPLIPTMHSVW